MRIAIMGIGGIGGYYGGLLARRYAGGGDHRVVFIARGDHLRTIRENGLRLICDRGEYTVHPDRAVDDPSEAGPFDLVLFCVKAYDLEESAALIAPHLSGGSALVSLLNGVDNADRLRSCTAGAAVLNGCVYLSSYIRQPGVVVQAGGSCKLFFGNETDAAFDGRSIEGLLQSADIDAVYSSDIQTMVWKKYLFISPFASATTFYGKPIRALLDNGAHQAMVTALVREALQVARAKGLGFPDDIVEKSLARAMSFGPDAKTSLQLDFEKGRQAELASLTGYVVREADRRGIDAPAHRQIYADLARRLDPQATAR